MFEILKTFEDVSSVFLLNRIDKPYVMYVVSETIRNSDSQSVLQVICLVALCHNVITSCHQRKL